MTANSWSAGGAPACTVRPWSEHELLAAREPWQALLARSSADPLFLSWDWATAWWQHDRGLLDAELRVLGVYDAARLVGIAPLYRRRTRVRGVPSRRIELLGGAWREPRAAFSEYLDLIAERGAETRVLDAVARHLATDRRWDELVFAYVPAAGTAARLAREWRGARVRESDPLDARRIALPATFEAYLASLSSDTRRKLRRRGAATGELRLEAADETDVEPWLDQLHAFRATRWGEEGGGVALRTLQKEIARRFARAGTLRLTRLVRDGRPISVLFDVRAGDAEYYLQSGFDADAAHGLSPGYLHLGFAIEQAIADGVREFDLLGGGGRHRDYKNDFGAARVPMTCLQVIRAPWLRALYFAHDALRARVERAPPSGSGVARAWACG